MESSLGERVKELHGDLARKYTIHAAKVATLWRSFTADRRASCMKAGALDGVVPKTSSDASLSRLCLIMPEWNLRDITARGPEVFLDLLKHRATQSLFRQYIGGVNDAPGDHAVIAESTQTGGLRHAKLYPNSYTYFTEDETYCQSFTIVEKPVEVLKSFKPAIDACLMIPQSMGDLVLERQHHLLQGLNIIVEDILDQGSVFTDRVKRKAKVKKPLPVVTAQASSEKPSAKQSIQDLILVGLDQATAHEEFANLLATEPLVLAHAVNIEFFTRPELVPDEQNRRLPMHTDRHIHLAFFEVFRKAFQKVACWTYLTHLLRLLGKHTTDKACRTIILQEISNVCYIEYNRAQAVFKRYTQSSTTAQQYFHRIANAFDKNGDVRVLTKQKPETLTRSDPQFHYVLNLCDPKILPNDALKWLEKLFNFYQSYPDECDRLDADQTDALYDLACIIEFTKDLRASFPMPFPSGKTGQIFTSLSGSLEDKISPLKTQLDVSKFAIPIDQLREGCNADDALHVLNEILIQKVGADFLNLYSELVDNCRESLQKKLFDTPSDESQSKPVPFGLTHSTNTPSSSTKQSAIERRNKEKTRPAQVTDIGLDEAFDELTVQESVILRHHCVRPSTCHVFLNLFTSSNRGPIKWDDFLAAMTDVGFSVEPMYGSVYRFSPLECVGSQKPLRIHRPHQSRIEGPLALNIARRLKRTYGWSAGTFVPQGS